MSFPILGKHVLAADCLVFFDFEATQFTHKAIALGVYAIPKKPGFLTFEGEPLLYHGYIKTKDDIGPVVRQMTGITPEILKKEGKSFYDTIREVTKLIRPFKKKCFISYGFMDMKILQLTTNTKDETERNFLAHVAKNYLDFHHYLEKRIVDEKGQSLSISKLMDLFHHQEDRPHDPLSDAKDLANIYLSYVSDEERTVDLVLAHYAKNPYMNKQNQKLAEVILEKGQATRADLSEIVKEYL